MTTSLDEIVRATGGRVVQQAAQGTFTSVVADSRSVRGGELFVALRGKRRDGHAFVAEAAAGGAGGAVVEQEGALPWPRELSVVRVADTTRALGDLAAFVRGRVAPPVVVAITGSNGKTSSKEMVAAAAARAWGPQQVLKTHGNENNLIGLPLTLLRLGGSERAVVLELGMNAFGEIARLTEIARPHYGLITNIGPAHLEGVGSVAGVAQAKAELWRGMEPAATAIVNNEDPWVVRMAAEFRGRRVTFGRGGDIEARDVRLHGQPPTEFTLSIGGEPKARVVLRLPGAHNVANALGAAATAWAAGVDPDTIAQALSEVSASPQRMEITTGPSGINVINDAYNANPASMRAALSALALMERGRKIAVLGGMRELGSAASSAHREIGEAAASLRLDYLLLLEDEHTGALAAGATSAGMPRERVRIGRSHEGIARWLGELCRPGDWVLIKGSRAAEMEKVLDALAS